MAVAARLALAGMVLATVASCSLISDCPTTLGEVRAAEFSAVDADTFAGTAFVIRYVPASDAAARGYDLNIMQVFHGERPPAGAFFLSVGEPIEGIAEGASVAVIAKPTSDEAVFVPGQCTPMFEVPA